MRYLLALMFSVVLCLPLLAQAAGQKTLLNAATANATGSNIATEDRGAVGVSVTISGTATVTFKASADGGVTFSPITCTNVDTLVTAQSASATGQFQCPVAGMSHFESPLSDCSACTVTSVATSSNGSFSSSGTSSSVISGIVQTGTNTAAAPSRAEASAGSFSFDLAGNARVTMGTLLSGEDQSNNLIMVGPGAVRVTSLGSMITATSSTPTIIPNGPVRFFAQIIGSHSETKAATLIIYGNVISSTTGGIPVCTVYLPSTGTTLQLQDVCPIMTPNYLYYYYTASVYTSAASDPLTVYATY